MSDGLKRRALLVVLSTMLIVGFGKVCAQTQTLVPHKQGQVWSLPSRCDFGEPGDFQIEAMSGVWEQKQGEDAALCQSSDQITSVVVIPNPDIERVRVKTAIKIDPTDEIGAEAGVVVQVENKDYYILCSIKRNKGGYYAVLTRYGAGYDFGRLPGDMARLAPDTANKWHTIEVLADGAHVRAIIDGDIKLAFSYPLINGMPISVGDQTKDIRLASNWGTEVYKMKGQVGLATRKAAAQFKYLEVDNLLADRVIYTPYNPKYDENGRVQARWPYSRIVKNYTDWMLESKDLVVAQTGGSVDAAGAGIDKIMEEKGWPPYFFSWATVVDDVGLDHPTQFPTHNSPGTISGFLRYYLYSGDEKYIAPAKQWVDWIIDEFTTGPNSPCPYLPKSTYCILARAYENHMLGMLELDKAAYTGLSYLELYTITGDKKYLTAAGRMAETLKKYRNPDGSFAFRISIENGEVVQNYTCSQLWHGQFFLSLDDITGNQEYRQIGEKAMKWLIDGPVRTNKWYGFYGDNPADTDDEKASQSFDQWVALETAQWLADHHTENEQFLPAAHSLLGFIEKHFFKMGGVHKGVPAIGEQTGWPAILPHHNMRLADTYARLCGATGDPQAKEYALRIANSMSQMVMEDGKFHHGLNSGIENRTALGLWSNLHYSRIMAEIPQTAPQNENHLLFASGYIKKIIYKPLLIVYQPLGPGQEILVVKSKPKEVTAGVTVLPELDHRPASRTVSQPAGWLYEEDTHRLFILHAKTENNIETKL